MSAVVAQSQRNGVDVAEAFAIRADHPAARSAVYDVLTYCVPASVDVAAG